ncbi:hypothetical protein [Antarcticibacterium flavum]|uniref:hypothetical protein n=1 Tax=Antarcticibacterium flavum TaxID=2058175 RepID=UPI0026C83C18|nr:hypothetical protein [Antarcticibacterium flavum]
MSYQSEAVLENNLVKQLETQGYERVQVNSEASVLANLKSQLEAFNNTSFSEKEFGSILNHLAKGNVFEKGKTLRGRYQLTRDNEDSFYVRFLIMRIGQRICSRSPTRSPRKELTKTGMMSRCW